MSALPLLKKTTEDVDALARIRDIMGVPQDVSGAAFLEALPFSVNDATAGAENELQAVVTGRKSDVDFPITIERSNYYKNLLKRAASGETSHRTVAALQDFLNHNPENVWENSWVRFPESVLSSPARRIFQQDLSADKTDAKSAGRMDSGKFMFIEKGMKYLRVPVSYLLKLALADAVNADPAAHPAVIAAGHRYMTHFLNDNTSPEVFSFYPVPVKRSLKMGRGVARETLKRFGLIQVLLQYARRKFGLDDAGQWPMVYFAPHTHLRQKRLNDLISDSFYRELFMSPCLSGWDRGEEKHRYMCLCHQVLSRSQINTLPKLKEAGIISRNLVVLPSLSNLSLANNGTHISLGSRKLSRLMADTGSGFTRADEKCLGDLVIKIQEHFLPLFVGTYSGAPYRLDFWDFHPEKLLGFLPHQLDFTHLRMLWRRWRKKANMKVFGHPVTPFGPEWMDRGISRLLGLKGDFVRDFRLLDYFVAVMSTEQSPALNGCLDNDCRLKQDLADFGIFDAAMPLYMLCRLREFAKMGFSGFEARYYSMFEDIQTDMGEAASLQLLVSALAYRYVLSGEVTHADIPDTPVVESERRQIFFGAAVGIPTFFVHRNSKNRFLNGILKRVGRTRSSRRYPGYVRVYHHEYRRALAGKIMADGAGLVELLGLENTVNNLMHRLEAPEIFSAADRLTKGILEHAGAKAPMDVSGEVFNTAAESYYRNILRRKQFVAAVDILEQDMKTLDAYAALDRGVYRNALKRILGTDGAGDFFRTVRRDLLDETLDADTLTRLIHLMVLSIRRDEAYQQETGEP